LETKIWLMTHTKKKRKQKLSQLLNLVKSFKVRQSFSIQVLSLIFHIKTLFDEMVIDFHMLSYRGPLQKQWSSILHIEALYKSNDHRSFISRPSSMEWSLIFICFHIEALCKGNCHRSFIPRPSSMEWSLFFLMFALM